MRRICSAMLTFIIISLLLMTASAVAEPYDPTTPESLTANQLNAYAAIVIDADSGVVLFRKNADARMHPASTTKIMTLLLGLERGIPLDREIAIPQAAADIPSDSTLIPVYPGDTMSYGDLLTAFMLTSGNDGANAVAVIAAGSIDNFVAQMNARAAEIGCKDTHFANPHGYTDDAHYTTAEDLALITRTAMQNETFRSIVRKTSATVNIMNRGEKTVSSQHLIMREGSGYYYRECIGVKTGTTYAAGKCFVGAAERDGATLISVVMLCETDEARWTDTIRLFNYGWTRYDAVSFDRIYSAAADRIASYIVSNAKSDDPEQGHLRLDVASISNRDYRQIIVRDNADAFNALVDDLIAHTTIRITHELTAPIVKGEVIGDLTYTNTQTGEQITAMLVAARDVDERPSFLGLADLFPFVKMLENKTFVILLGVLALLFILIIALIISRSAGKQRRRREILERRRHEYENSGRRSAQYSMRGESRKGKTKRGKNGSARRR